MKVLLIGSSFSAVPFLKALKTMGAEVTVIGMYPDDPCHALADASLFEDYSNPDTLLQICRTHDFDFLVPSCNDYSYVAGAAVAHALGMPGFDRPEVTTVLHNKDSFRRFCRDAGVPAPQLYAELTEADVQAGLPGEVAFPLMVKPVDSFSGRGVELVLGRSELPSAVDRAMNMSRDKRVVMEQFVTGSLHSHTAFVAGGAIIWHDFVDEYCRVYQYQVDGSAYPSSVPDALREAVNEAMAHLVGVLGLVDGLLHTQFIASDDRFWIIECMRRCPGDLYGHHFQYSYGYNYEAEFVKGFVGQRPTAPAASTDIRMRVERRVLSVDTASEFFGLRLSGGADEVIYVPLKESGMKMAPAPFDKAGILFVRGAASSGRQALANMHSTLALYQPHFQNSAKQPGE